MLADIRPYSGVTCFTAEADNQRMWAAYGHDHCGACLEFALGSEPSPFQGRLLPVIYCTGKTGLTFAVLINGDGSLSEEALIFLSTIKHTHWRDERSGACCFWTTRIWGGYSRHLPLSPDTMSRVFLGPRISESDEAEMKTMADHASIPVFRRSVDGLFGHQRLRGPRSVIIRRRGLLLAQETEPRIG